MNHENPAITACKAMLLVCALLFAASILAQSPNSPLPAACGPDNASLKVKLDYTAHAPAQPEPGKALVYFIHDAGAALAHSIGYPTLRLGVDGAWVGANHGDSWFAVSVAPGEHHLCVTLQSSFADQRVQLAHLQAEAGRVYYYRTRLFVSGTAALLELDPIDSDQGKYLIASYPLSVSRPKP
jgi:hypothetical protein